MSQCWCDSSSKSTSSLPIPTSAIWGRLMTSLVPRTSSKLLKYWQNSGDASLFLLFSLEAFYAAFKFLILFLHCVLQSFLGCACLLPLWLFAILWHTLAFLVKKKKFSFQSFTRVSVCFADQHSFCVWLNNFFFSCASWSACFFLLILLYCHCFLFLICQVILKRWWDLI